MQFTFTGERPAGFWEELQASEYDFWANVNPEVPHPRWSQATERVVGTDKCIPTQLYNGYGEFAAGLYEGLEIGSLHSINSLWLVYRRVRRQNSDAC